MNGAGPRGWLAPVARTLGLEKATIIGMKATLTLCGVGLAGCLGVFLLFERSSPPSASFRAPQPARALAAVSSSPAPGDEPSTESLTEAPVVASLSRTRVSSEDSRFGNALRPQILAAMASPDPNNQEVVFSLLAEWIQHDPAGAGRFAKTLPPGRWRETTIRRVAQDWAAKDLAGAEKWASRLPDATERNSTLTDVCFQVAQTDARHAVEIAEENGLGAGRGAVLENLVQQWAGQDVAAAYAWTLERPAGEERDQMMGRLAYVQSQSEPAAAANVVVDQIPSGSIQNEAAMSVLHQWALRDMASATAWVDRFPPGALRDRAELELKGLAAYAR